MASASTVIDDFLDSPDKEAFYANSAKLVIRWLNESQLRHVNKSEVLRDMWTPDITSSGNIILPGDFLRECPDLVQANVGTTGRLPLFKIDYSQAILYPFSGLTHYSIHNGYFYVWAAQACTPRIVYFKKPEVITAENLEEAELEIPTECHNTLLHFMDAQFIKSKGDYQNYLVMLNEFERRAINDGIKFRNRNDNPARMR
jgi:hypothetical protein